MAVYTQLGTGQIEDLLSQYDVGALVSAKGIAEGVSNSNWLVETAAKNKNTKGRYILTMYERRIDPADLPFFLALLDHLAAKSCPVPRTIHRCDGSRFTMVEGKAVALIEFLPGTSPDRPTEAQAWAIGAALAQIHLGAADFPHERANPLGPQHWCDTLADYRQDLLEQIAPALPAMISEAQSLAQCWPNDLPRCVIHSDLFPDNALFLGDKVNGLIDFYFACTDFMAYDLAVTHAAWSFDKQNQFKPGIGNTIVSGYESVRPLEPAERAALPVLAQGACMRFVASRTADWIETSPSALVTRKDPVDFVRRLTFYREHGCDVFPN